MKQTYQVEGMSCASCSAHVEKALNQTPGVEHAEVNLLMNQATVDGDVSYETLASAVDHAGYTLVKPVVNKSVDLDIEGMTCASCVAHVEKALNQVDGVKQVEVNLLMNKGHVEYDPAVVKSGALLQAIERSGYHAKIAEKTNQEAIDLKQKKLKQEKRSVILALFFAALVLYVAMAHMFTIKLWLPDIISPHHQPLNFALTQLVLTVPVVVLCFHYYISGFKALLHRAPNMDSLVALGTSAAFIYSLYGLWQILLGNDFAHALYFESGAVVLALIKLGKYFELVSKNKTTNAISALLNLKPKTATLWQNNEEVIVSSDEIAQGDIVVIKPGESVPVDGVIIEGHSSLDESMLTGESLPIDKAVNDEVVTGTLNINGRLLVRALAVDENTKLAKIVQLVENAQAHKAPIAKIADQISGVFVPVVMLIALVSGLLWYFVGGESLEFALTIFVTVLVIACPCALGLATPTAIMVGTGKGAEHGIFIKSADALEAAAKINAVIFDKTGTLTIGKPVVVDVIETSEINHDRLIQMVASIEAYSEHPLGQAIVDEAKKRSLSLESIQNFEAIIGEGVVGQYQEVDLWVGNDALMGHKGVDISKHASMLDALSDQGKTVLWVAYDHQLVGMIAVADVLKDEAVDTVKALHQQGIHVVMLTGDHQKTAEAIAKQAGIEQVFAQVKPEQKADKVKALQAEGYKVAMIGDGINDSVALVQSDVGIAIGSGTDVAIESADIVLMRSDLKDIVKGLRLSKATLKNIKENLFWAFAYNVIGIPFAAGVFYLMGGPLLNPMLAGAAMALSSVSVVTNALRLRRFK